MGTLVGHVAPGFGFFIIGLWHLLNHIKNHAISPKSYKSLPWFPTSKIRYLELFLIMAGSSMSIAMELFIGPDRHQPLDPDGTIPSNHLHNFEHSNISITFFMYAAFSILLDKLAPPANYGLTFMLGAIAFGQQLLLFHLHSADHMGVEGQYHWLLQIAIFSSLVTTLLGINYPKSFLNSFARSISIMFQGVWLMVMGFMLWTPEFIPKGCFMNLEEDHQVVRCQGEEALGRAKSLVNIQFSWYVVGMTTFSVSLYLIMIKLYPQKVEYRALSKFEELEEEIEEDVEAQKKGKSEEPKSTFLQMGKSFAPMDMESLSPIIKAKQAPQRRSIHQNYYLKYKNMEHHQEAGSNGRRCRKSNECVEKDDERRRMARQEDVNKMADEFINNFRKQLKFEREESLKRYHQMPAKGT
ncbi:unnamed protein product [Fraxinus pennsylvanica]|uniref:Transmembrane protein 45A n=1 Tax=Fraxinus pennsylvanica TaxID=56036 RepID=A0AAD2DPB4_9LAMI|nr:unnamed protein product [Fraxinus pennsylvanica]